MLRVDGGMTASDWTMQFLSDILGAPVDRPKVLETTALGAAWLAGSRRLEFTQTNKDSQTAGPAIAALSRKWTRRAAIGSIRDGKTL